MNPLGAKDLKSLVGKVSDSMAPAPKAPSSPARAQSAGRGGRGAADNKATSGYNYSAPKVTKN